MTNVSLPVNAASSCAVQVTAWDSKLINCARAGAAYSTNGEKAVPKEFLSWVILDISMDNALLVSSEYWDRLSIPSLRPPVTADIARNTVLNRIEVASIRPIPILAPLEDFSVFFKPVFNFLVSFPAFLVPVVYLVNAAFSFFIVAVTVSYSLYPGPSPAFSKSFWRKVSLSISSLSFTTSGLDIFAFCPISASLADSAAAAASFCFASSSF